MQRRDYAALFLICLAFFWIWSPPTVTMEDSGEFISGAFTLGVLHPPGYPLFTYLAHVFTLIPLGSVAERVDFFNHLMGALAVLAIAAIAWQLTQSRLWAATSGALFAMSRTFWFQASTAEVYALNCAFFFWIFWLALQLRKKFTPKLWYLFLGLVGLSLTNHWPILVLTAPAIAALLWPVRRQLSIRLLSVGLLVLLAPLLLYLDLYFRSQGTAAINFLGPMQSLGDLIRYIGRDFYSNVTVEPMADWSDYFRFQLFYLRLPAMEYLPILLPIALVGLWQLRKDWVLILSLALIFFSTTLWLHIPLRMEYRLELQETVRVYQLIPMGALALLMAVGAVWIAKKWPNYFSKTTQTALAVVLLACQFAYNFREGNLHQDSFALDYAKIVLEAMPPNAFLLTQGDADSGPIAYANLVEKIRPDVEIATQSSVFLARRVFSPLEQRGPEGARAAITSLVKEKGRIFSTRRLDVFADNPPTDLRFRFNGFFYEIMAPSFVDQPIADLREPVQAFADQIASGNYGRQWPSHRNSIVGHVCNFLVLNNVSHALFESDPGCRLILAKHFSYLKQFEKADPLFVEAIRHFTLMRRHEYDDLMEALVKNRLAWLAAQPPINATQVYQDLVNTAWPAVERFAHCKNRTLQALVEPIAKLRLSVDRELLSRKYVRCKWMKPYLSQM